MGWKNICFLVVVFQSSYTAPSLSPRSAILLWSGTGKWLPWSNVKRDVWEISVYSLEDCLDNARKRPRIFTFSLLLCNQLQTICRQLFTMQPQGDHSWLLATKAIAMIFSVCHCAPICNKFSTSQVWPLVSTGSKPKMVRTIQEQQLLFTFYYFWGMITLPRYTTFITSGHQKAFFVTSRGNGKCCFQNYGCQMPYRIFNVLTHCSLCLHYGYLKHPYI